MSVGLRIRDMDTGAVRLEISDFLVSSVYMQNVQVNGNGSVNIPGIDSVNYIAFLVPCFAAGITRPLGTNPPGDARVYISGTTVVWECGPHWLPGLFTLQVVRVR